MAIYGDRGADPLLVYSQVVLSLQLPFAIIPLGNTNTDTLIFLATAYEFKQTIHQYAYSLTLLVYSQVSSQTSSVR